MLPESELPGPPPKGQSLPAPKSWAEKNPNAFARLEIVREGLAQLSELLSIPVENLMTPELVRRACWSEPLDTEAAYNQLLEAGGAREWQRELVLPIVYAARQAQPLPAEDPEPET